MCPASFSEAKRGNPAQPPAVSFSIAISPWQSCISPLFSIASLPLVSNHSQVSHKEIEESWETAELVKALAIKAEDLESQTHVVEGETQSQGLDSSIST